MTLLFMDGFSHYATGNLTSKYFSSNATIGAFGRNGGKGMIFYGEDYSTTKVLAGAYPTIYIGFGLKVNAIGPAWNNNSLLSFYEDATKHMDLRMQEGNTGRLVMTRNGTILGTTADQVLFIEEYVHMQIKVYIHDSEGTVDMLANGVNILSLTNQDTKNGGAGTINKFAFGGPKNTNMSICDLWIDDSEFLGDCKVETLLPSAAGDTTAWTPSAGANHECVDEVAPDGDTTYVTSDTPDDVDTYEFTDLVTAAGVVKGVQVLGYVRKDDAGSRSVALVTRPVSTDRVGDTVSLGDSYTYISKIWELNPEDSEAWEIADVNGAEFGVKLVS